MKKTKYISIAYLLFISVTILITYIDAKAHVHENTNLYSDEIKVIAKAELNDFKVLVACKGIKISVFKDTINQLNEYSYSEKIKTELKENIDYKISGDTVYIYKVTKTNLKLYTKNLLKIIAEKNSNISISNYASKTLSIASEKAKIYGNSNKIQKLTIEASDRAQTNFYDSAIDTVFISSNNSKIYNVRNKTKELNATLKDSSFIKSSEPLLLNVTADTTSRYTIQGK